MDENKEDIKQIFSDIEIGSPEYKSFIHPSNRDILFVFGAGASKSSKMPLQNEILEKIISNKEVKNTAIGKIVIKFIKDNFYCDNGHYPTLESVFGYIDYFLIQDTHLNDYYSIEKIKRIKEGLVILIYSVFKIENIDSDNYEKFWLKIFNHNTNISVISLNYDTLLDDSFDYIYNKGGFLDYCIPLINYDSPEGMNPFDWWVNPREPLACFGGKEPFVIKLIKLHGSLNWKYCKCCNSVFLTPWNMDEVLDLKKGIFKIPDFTEYYIRNQMEIFKEHKCPIDKTLYETLLIPPSHIKNLKSPLIALLFNEALKEIRCSKKIVFIGYSFPEADVHFKALFKKGIVDQKIYVVDPFVSNNLISNYSALSKKTVFLEMTFEKFLDSEEFIEILNKN